MISKIKIENWKNHENSEFEFSKGINAIIGNMGAGKSSILQSISFALFGTFSELKSREIKLPDLVNRKNNAKNARITLTFNNYEGIAFEVERKILNGISESILRNKEGNILAGPQVQEVNSYIEKILGINQNLWLRTVYARQNEIDYFLNIIPGRRKKEIDELMGLNKFEEARKNAVKLVNILDNRIKDKTAILKDFKLEDLNKKIVELTQSLEEKKKEILEVDTNIRIINEEKNKIREELENKKNKANEWNKLNEKFSLIREELVQLEKSIINRKIKNKQELEKDLELIKKKISDNQSKKQELKKIIDDERNKLLELEKQLSILKERKSEVEKNITKISQLNEKLKDYLDIENKLNKINDLIEENKSAINKKIGEINSLKLSLDELKKAKDVCPVCSNKLDEKHKEELIFLKIASISAIEKEVKKLKEELNDLEKEQIVINNKNDERKKIINQLETYKTTENKETLLLEINKLESNKPKLVEDIINNENNIKQIEKELEEFSQKYMSLQEEKNWSEKIERKEKLEEELEKLTNTLDKNKNIIEELKELENKFEEIIKKSQELQTKKEYIIPLIKEKEERLEEFNKNKQELEKQELEIEKTKKQIEFLNRFKNSLIQAQGELRRELILAVNEIMANIWQDIYPYDKFIGVRLLAENEDYILQIKEAEGDWLSVAGFASGGERMIASLALRIAFAKVLAPKLNILILDEPTHNLDKNAIETFTKVIKERLSKLLTQTFIVTHEEKLAESADNLIKIKK